MDLSCGYNNIHTRTYNNDGIDPKGDIDEDDDIFKQKDILMKVKILMITIYKVLIFRILIMMTSCPWKRTCLLT